MPVDHPLRGLYRALALLSGVALVVWGAIGLARTASDDFFGTHGPRVLGMTANPAFSVVCIVLGLIVALATLVGHNIDAQVDRIVSVVLVLFATVGLCTLRTDDLDVFSFSVTNVNVLYTIATILFTAGLYVSASGATRAPRPTSAGSDRREPVGSNH
jgi:hypothetical protein